MADDAAAQEGQEEQGGGRKMLPIILGVVGVGVLSAGAALGAGYFLWGGDSGAAPEAGQTGEVGASQGDADMPNLTPRSEVISLGQFTVNLRDSAGGRLLQMEISVEGDSDAAAMVTEREAQLRDAILMLASDYSFLELEGLDGKIRLRDEIQRRVNTILAPEKVNRVYFTAFVVQ